MRFISLCDGIGAAQEAWAPLGWVQVARAEIDPFPIAVAAARHPGPPNLGDVTQITEDQIALLGPVDVVIFGSPCQDLSVAGQRKGLAGARSGLFFDCLRVALWARDHCGARWVIWENVPGAFSSHKGADFALVVGAMAGSPDCRAPKNGWGHEGCAVGDNGMVEWAVLDAQWFGLAQRRKRVFAVLDLGDWARRPPILLERQGLRGDTPPRRAQGQGVTGPSAEGAGGCGFPGTDGATSGHVVPVGQLDPMGLPEVQGRQHGPLAPSDLRMVRGNGQFGPSVGFANSGEFGALRTVDVGDPLRAKGGDTGNGGETLTVYAFGGNDTRGPIDVATARNAHGGPHGRLDFESETFVAQAYNIMPQNSGKDYKAKPADVAQPLLAAGPGGSSAQGGDVIAFALRGRDDGAQPEVHGPGDAAGALRAASGGSTRDYVAFHHNAQVSQLPGPGRDTSVSDSLTRSQQAAVASAYAVRRLTPTECHRLQGFADDHCAVTYRGKPAADGPMYKALGNSIALPVLTWVGEQIEIASLF